MLELAVFVEIADLKRLGEILSQVVRSAGLQRFPIAHHRFNGVGLIGAGESFGIRFQSGHHREWRLH